ncbi:MAG: lipopolysaccharide biosynthesis protein [Melioribacteraceae bacterium]|nr:lipopolysaccharide biosynthesis protein [Melioribacteraceae bacterium]
MNKTEDIANKAIRGTNWNVINVYSKTIISFFVGIILARVLLPEDFGLFGMTLVFTGFADLFATMGMSMAVVRLKEITDNHLRVAFTLTLILSIVIYLTFFLLSPAIASFYGEVELVEIIRTVSLLFLFKGVSSIGYGLLVKEINFKYLFKSEISSFVFGYTLFAVTLALLGFGVWSLVIGKLVGSTITLIFLTLKVKVFYRPLISKKEFSELFNFGTGFSLSKILFYLSSNVSNLLIGKFLSSASLGLYTKSFNLMTLPINQLSSVLYNVVFPTFAKVQDDIGKLRNGYLRIIRTITFLLFPILAGAYFCAEYLVLGLYGENWVGAIEPLKLLCIAGLFKITLSYSGSLAHASGRVYSEAFRQFINLIIIIVGVLIGVNYGLFGVCIAIIVSNVWLFIAHSNLAINILKINWYVFLKNLVPSIVNAFIISVLNYITISFIEQSIDEFSVIIKLIIMAAVNVIAFILLIFFLPKSIKGDTVSWMSQKYIKAFPKMPNIIKNLLPQ